MRKNSTIDQLRTLNELFAHTCASTPDRAEHIRHVLDLFNQEQGKAMAELSFAEGADRLAQLHFGSEGEQDLLFAHWAVPNDEYFNPLWIRKALITQMKQLAGSRSAFLLITGLREAVCPAGSYWTKKRQDYYDQVCNYINELVCEWAASGVPIQIVLFEQYANKRPKNAG